MLFVNSKKIFPQIHFSFFQSVSIFVDGDASLF